jgi:hypothetical protein
LRVDIVAISVFSRSISTSSFSYLNLNNSKISRRMSTLGECPDAS